MFYYTLIVIGFFGLAAVFARKRYGQNMVIYSSKYFRRFKKDKEEIINIPVETATKEASQCPAAVLSNEPNILQKDDEHEMVLCLKKAEEFMKKEEYDDAEKMFVKVLAFQDSHVQANLKLGFIYLKKEQFAKAEAIFRKIIGINCTDSTVYSNLANSLYHQHKLHDSCEAYLKAISMDPTNGRRYLNLGRVLFEMNNFDGAIEYISQAVQLDPKNADALSAMADAYLSLNNFDKAQEFIEAALKTEKGNYAAKVISKKLKAKKKEIKKSTEL